MSDQSLSNVAFLAHRFKVVLDFSGDPQVLNEIEQHARAEGIMPEWWLVERIGQLHRQGLLHPTWKKPVKVAAILAGLIFFGWLSYYVILVEYACQWSRVPLH